ncbi:MAG: MgtC/SapB family protein [Hyphomonadaceae bacterium]
MDDALLFDLFQRLGLALGIGFLIGVEREWTHRDVPEGGRAAGVRTHAIIGLTGGVSAAMLPAIGELGFAALALGYAAALIVFKVRESLADGDLSVTGTIAALLVYMLGAYAVLGDLRVAAAAGVVLAGLLAFKQAIHDWVDKLTWKEIRSAFLILAATAIALPLLPDRTLDPWEAINPRELWLLTILVAGASFAGYVAVRVLGRDVGVLAGAAAGSLVSSTVVTAELGRRAKADETTPRTAAAAAALAAAISVVRVGILVSATTATLTAHIAPALGAAALAFVAGAFALRAIGRSDNAASAENKLRSPLYLASVAQFALFLGAVIVIGRIVADTFGEAGLLPFAATAGLADVDAVALAAGSLVRGGLEAATGAHAVLVAVVVNTYSKAVIAFVTGGWRYAAYYAASALIATIAGAAAWLLINPMLIPASS